METNPKHLPARFDDTHVRALVSEFAAACGARVRARRELLGMRRIELAQLAQTTEPTINRIEAGTLNPRDTLRMAIAGVLRCEVADLWTYPSCERIHEARVVA